MYWSVAQLQPNRERLALHCLQQVAGYTVYCPARSLIWIKMQSLLSNCEAMAIGSPRVALHLGLN
jgi:hypothetical protein